MNDVPLYMMVNLHITNPDTYRQYEKGFFPLLKNKVGSSLLLTMRLSP